MDAYDSDWLSDIEGIDHPTLTSVDDVLSLCLLGDGTQPPYAHGHLVYNATVQKEIIPNILTIAGVLDAVPLPPSHPLASNTSCIFNAMDKLNGFHELEATEFVYDNFVNETTTMAKLNPGWDMPKHNINPPLTGGINTQLFDFVVSQRLFCFFLKVGCLPLTKEHALEQKIAANNPWPKPVTVCGVCGGG